MKFFRRSSSSTENNTDSSLFLDIYRRSFALVHGSSTLVFILIEVYFSNISIAGSCTSAFQDGGVPSRTARGFNSRWMMSQSLVFTSSHVS
ncbi:uncharacterized protein IUM83_05619 [Phytophthora cinnamomi]|uniref:uncharacterized protein n=1 Tax=Phytophthora cinnamomi TaxID=4785 RepID=UPI003559AF7E|nr:hypothetical protein IUM83_05619 [Phytophthora cinnamomi]